MQMQYTIDLGYYDVRRAIELALEKGKEDYWNAEESAPYSQYATLVEVKAVADADGIWRWDYVINYEAP